MRNIKLFLVLFVIVLCFCSGAVWADLITISITAHVDYVEDTENVLGGTIRIGDFINGEYRYDTVPSEFYINSYTGSYKYYCAPSGLSLNINGIAFKTNPNDIFFHLWIENEHCNTDMYMIYVNNILPLENGTEVYQVSWKLSNHSYSDGTLITNVALPVTAPTLNGWQMNRLEIYGNGFNIRAHVISAQVTPEPATIALFALGGILFRKRPHLQR